MLRNKKILFLIIIIVIFLVSFYVICEKKQTAFNDECYSTIGIYAPKTLNDKVEKYFLEKTDIRKKIDITKSDNYSIETKIRFIDNNLEKDYYLVTAWFWLEIFKPEKSGGEQVMTFKVDKETNEIIEYSKSMGEGGEFIDSLLDKKYKNNALTSNCSIQEK
ncbi:hypothetical protein OKW22_000319 [Bacilli bacterium PM5-3]|nr:hypothetical protein [Bacilli bacterium PM5-3]MDH6604182.1 hypothetical protein [Bacilli bacterium PM5-9]